MVTTGDDVAAEADREPRIPADHFRSVAQLNMLHSLAAKLNSLGDAYEISSAITAELRTIVDYHSCRVYLLQPDGRTLYPVSFRGEMFSDYEKDTVESLITEIGEGITGHVAESRDSLITPDARDVAFAVQIPGTDDVLESMLAVPMAVGDQLLGVITLSMLGYGKFDEEDQRLLEVLASHAAVALQNAKLFQAEREAAETSTSLLRLSQTLTQLHSVEDILQEAMDTVPHLVVASGLAAYLRDEETGDFHLLRLSITAGDPSTPTEQDAMVSVVPSEVATSFLSSESGPFVVSRDVVQQIPPSTACSVRSARCWSLRCTGSRMASVPSCWEPRRSMRGSPTRICVWPEGSPTSRRSPSATHGDSRSWSGSTSSSPAWMRSTGRQTLRRSDSRSSGAEPNSSWAPTSRSGSRRDADGAITHCPKIAKARSRPRGSLPTPARTRVSSTACPRQTAARSGSATWCTWCAAPRGHDSSAA